MTSENPLGEDKNHANWGLICLVGCWTMVAARLQGGTTEALRAHHPEREIVLDGGRRSTKQSGGRSVTWNVVRLSMTILYLSASPPPILPGPPGGEGKVWGIMAWAGVTRGTRISTKEKPL